MKEEHINQDPYKPFKKKEVRKLWLDNCKECSTGDAKLVRSNL